eukprot:2379221-Rhodomonas_salina.3
MSYAQTGYKICCAVDKNISLSGAHQRVIARLMMRWDLSKRKITETMPFRSRAWAVLHVSIAPLVIRNALSVLTRTG